MNKYKIIAICGKSAAGKDTFLQHITKIKGTHEIISCTTRPKREGEENGVNNHFLTLEDFVSKDCKGEMLEISTFRDWFYGTPIDSLDKNKINVGVFNPTGIANLLRNDNVQIYVVQVIANDKTRLLRSLNREENPNVDEIVRRYMTDKKDFEDFSAFYETDFYISNEGQGIDPSKALALSEQIVDEARRTWAEKAN